jgi:hypothetical protein
MRLHKVAALAVQVAVAAAVQQEAARVGVAGARQAQVRVQPAHRPEQADQPAQAAALVVAGLDREREE